MGFLGPPPLCEVFGFPSSLSLVGILVCCTLFKKLRVSVVCVMCGGRLGLLEACSSGLSPGVGWVGEGLFFGQCLVDGVALALWLHVGARWSSAFRLLVGLVSEALFVGAELFFDFHLFAVAGVRVVSVLVWVGEVVLVF